MKRTRSCFLVAICILVLTSCQPHRKSGGEDMEQIVGYLSQLRLGMTPEDYEKIFGHKGKDIGSGEYLYEYRYGNVRITLLGYPLRSVFVRIDDEEDTGFYVGLEQMAKYESDLESILD